MYFYWVGVLKKAVNVPTFPALVILPYWGLVWLRSKSPRPGFLFSAFLICYRVWRFAINLLQLAPPVLAGLSYVQWTGLAIPLTGVTYLAFLYAKRRPQS
jgi:prolipoprotein diacylglyceryltransferase